MKILAKPIETVVWFKGQGRPQPVKFRYSDAEGGLHKVRVDKVLETEATRTAGIPAVIYRCQSLVEGIEVRYELKYLINDCRWELYKM